MVQPLSCFFHMSDYRPFLVQDTNRVIPLTLDVQKLNPSINVQLVGDGEVFEWHTAGHCAVQHNGRAMLVLLSSL
jgi:hypothetical protein